MWAQRQTRTTKAPNPAALPGKGRGSGMLAGGPSLGLRPRVLGAPSPPRLPTRSSDRLGAPAPGWVMRVHVMREVFSTKTRQGNPVISPRYCENERPTKARVISTRASSQLQAVLAARMLRGFVTMCKFI